MPDNDVRTSSRTDVAPSAVRSRPGGRVSRHDLVVVRALVMVVALAAGGAADTFAKGPPGATAGAKTSSARTEPAERTVTAKDREYMRVAIDTMRQAGVVDKTGGPFGAVVVLDGKIISVCGNSVTKDLDPTAHAEVNAIREACRKLKTVDLSGAVLYSSCEPCPLCYAASYWSRLSKVFYAATYGDYSDIFDDAKISIDIVKPYAKRQLAPQQILRPEAQKVWQEFRKLPDGARY